MRPIHETFDGGTRQGTPRSPERGPNGIPYIGRSAVEIGGTSLPAPTPVRKPSSRASACQTGTLKLGFLVSVGAGGSHVPPNPRGRRPCRKGMPKDPRSGPWGLTPRSTCNRKLPKPTPHGLHKDATSRPILGPMVRRSPRSPSLGTSCCAFGAPPFPGPHCPLDLARSRWRRAGPLAAPRRAGTRGSFWASSGSA